ncbi:MAG TPA: GntR family transcriptional regulator, partial [Methylomirabilota bacterium]|nr:GntR family transcriptional regulator [Methylomirabilota bacterium]
ETVQDRVYSELRRALICGLFDPGQVLTIQSLADSLATSTMPVREALGRLISEKALEALPNRSIRVPVVTGKRVDDLLHARVLIEGEAIALATPRLKAHEIDQLKGLTSEWLAVKRARKPERVERELELNRAFHFQIYRASGSDVLIPIIESLWLQSGPYVRAAAVAFDDASRLSSDFYHGEIIAALDRRDSGAARTALAADIGRAFDLLRAPEDRAARETPA